MASVRFGFAGSCLPLGSDAHRAWAARFDPDRADLERARDAATANGGTIVEDITDVPGQGRYVIVRDPEGSELALWQNPSG